MREPKGTKYLKDLNFNAPGILDIHIITLLQKFISSKAPIMSRIRDKDMTEFSPQHLSTEGDPLSPALFSTGAHCAHSKANTAGCPFCYFAAFCRMYPPHTLGLSQTPGLCDNPSEAHLTHVPLYATDSDTLQWSGEKWSVCWPQAFCVSEGALLMTHE